MVALTVHSRPRVPYGTWGFVLLGFIILGFIILAFLIPAGCEQTRHQGQTAEKSLAPLGLRLEIEGLKPLEAAVLIRPAAKDAAVVGPMSSLLGVSLKACQNQLAELAPGKTISLSLWVEEGKVAASFDAKPSEALKTCLYKQLHDKLLPALKPNKREVDLQLRWARTP